MTSSTSSSERGRREARRDLVPRFLAVILPLAVLALALGSLRPGDEDEEPSPFLAAIRAGLDETEPEILVVGNSLVYWGVDAGAIERATGRRTFVVRFPGTRPAQWYALLRHMVYEAGHRPEIVLLGTTPGWGVSLGLSDSRSRGWLSELMGMDEPVLARKVFGSGPVAFAWARLMGRRAVLRERAFGTLRDRAARLAGAGPGEVEAMLDRALATSADTAGERRRTLPVVDVRSEGAAGERGDVLDPDGGLLPDILELVTAHGSRFGLVWMPVQPGSPGDLRLSPDTEMRVYDILRDGGGALIDLRESLVSRSDFKDRMHLNPRGQRIVTRAIAEALEREGLLSGAVRTPEVPLPLVAPPAFRRIGEVPRRRARVRRRADTPCGFVAPAPEFAPLGDRRTLEAGLGRATPVVLYRDGRRLSGFADVTDREERCAGAASFGNRAVVFSSPDDPGTATEHEWEVGLAPEVPLVAGWREVFWVYPGGGVAVDLAPPWAELPARDGLVLEAMVRPFGDGSGAIRLRVGEETVEAVPVGPRRVARLVVRPPGGSWSVVVEADEDAPAAVIERLVLRHDGGAFALVGEVGSRPADEVTLVGIDDGAPLEVVGGGPPLPRVEGRARADGLFRAELADLAFLATDAVKAAGCGVLCSPLRLVRDGAPVPGPLRSCAEVRQGNEPAWCFASGVLLYRLPPGWRPRRGVVPMAFDLDVDRAGRACEDGGHVLAPGTRARRELSSPVAVPGARVVRLRGRVLGPTGTAPLAVRLRLADGTIRVARLDPEALDGEDLAVARLDGPLDEAVVEVVLANPNDGSWVSLTELAVALGDAGIGGEPAALETGP